MTMPGCSDRTIRTSSVVTVRPSAEDMQQVAVQAGVLASQLASR